MNPFTSFFSNIFAAFSKQGKPAGVDAPLPVLKGDGTWPWVAHVDGADIIIKGARATCFGGSNDPQDSGETASGISTKKNPNLAACSLPMRYSGTNKSIIKALGGSPLPKLPWRTMVEVTANGKKITVPVVDIGPAKYTGNAIDLTIAAARKFDSKASAARFELYCDIRILGGAQYLSIDDYA